MSPALTAVAKELRSMGATAEMLRAVTEAFDNKVHPAAPRITKPVANKLREMAALKGKAILVLCTNRKYKVFSPEGHDVLRESAEKHKPWLMTKASKSHGKKH